MITGIKEVLPPNNTIPIDYYHHRKTINELGLPMVKIYTCKNGCILYWKYDDMHISCEFYNELRYKQIKVERRLLDNCMHKKIAQSIIRYLPLTTRLQRLYTSCATPTHMTWLATHERNKGVMQHLFYGKAWKHFDGIYPNFAKEPRNVHFNLCANGFALHGHFGRTCWPTVVTP